MPTGHTQKWSTVSPVPALKPIFGLGSRVQLLASPHILELDLDKVCLAAAGLSDLREDIELEHSLMVRTSFADE